MVRNKNVNLVKCCSIAWTHYATGYVSIDASPWSFYPCYYAILVITSLQIRKRI